MLKLENFQTCGYIINTKPRVEIQNAKDVIVLRRLLVGFQVGIGSLLAIVIDQCLDISRNTHAQLAEMFG